MLKRMTIGQRVALLASSLLLFVCMIGGVGLAALHKLDVNLEDLLDNDVAFSRQMDQLESSMLRVRQAEKDILLSLGNPPEHEKNLKSTKAKFDKNVAALSAEVKEARSLVRLADKQGELAALEGNVDAYRQGMEALYLKLQSGEITQANHADAAIQPFKTQLYALRDQVTALRELADGYIDAADGKQEAMLGQIRNVMLGALALALVLGVLLAVLIVRSITRPLGGLQASMRQAAAQNDLTIRIDTSGQDEVSETARALSTLLGNLSAFVERTRGDSQRVSATSRSMSDVASRITEASNEQADASSSTAAVVEQMTTGIARVAEHASKMAGEARSSMEMSVEGSRVAGQAAAEMAEIAKVIRLSEASIATLSQRSSEIGSIVGVIREIAEQTNLLALNAAIEAARAGESGRGFAVVADEVRKLAERTAQATNEISSKISLVQGETKTAVASMQQAAGQVSSGVELSRTVADTLEMLRELSAQVLGKTDEIASAMLEQSHASQEAARSVEHIAQMSESNSRSVAESATMASELSKLSSELDLEIGRFRT
ncbi:methyl-accepting chemotaxis protein [Craterilacuibacter sinensis]|uniref:HAMP domain-containing protein n=1 Tax=Craterilacuibacter sinensis TaxID=2686017 RepID=A0A845BIQ8_9NEIS|nr:methyl-accepting chemotaxis protein [Craterilacuibacter sinensis]MXR36062.1 HAMP domain-containing protein [Craterilacuibacter sinensis]